MILPSGQKARLITKTGKHVVTLELEPNAPLPIMLAHKGQIFHFETWIGQDTHQYREITSKDWNGSRKHSKTDYE
jgi:hypothetical protein